MIQTIYSDPYLMHHGVKGQKWGVRKSIENSMQVRGYRAGSKYIQRRDIRKLKAKKKSGQITKEQYKSKKKQVTNAAMVARGKDLVEHNQTIMKTTLKGLGNNAATTTGALIVFAMSSGAGIPAVGIMGLMGASAKNVANTIETTSRINDIATYEKSKSK